MLQFSGATPWPAHSGNFWTVVVVLVVGIGGLVAQWLVGRWQDVRDGARRYEEFLFRGVSRFGPR